MSVNNNNLYSNSSSSNNSSSELLLFSLGVRGLNTHSAIAIEYKNKRYILGKGEPIKVVTVDTENELYDLALSWYLNEQPDPFLLAIIVKKDQRVKEILKEKGMAEFVSACESLPLQLLEELEKSLREYEKKHKVEIPLSIIIGIADALRMIEQIKKEEVVEVEVETGARIGGVVVGGGEGEEKNKKVKELLEKLRSSLKPIITDQAYYLSGEEIRQIIEYHILQLKRPSASTGDSAGASDTVDSLDTDSVGAVEYRVLIRSSLDPKTLRACIEQALNGKGHIVSLERVDRERERREEEEWS